MRLLGFGVDFGDVLDEIQTWYCGCGRSGYVGDRRGHACGDPECPTKAYLASVARRQRQEQVAHAA